MKCRRLHFLHAADGPEGPATRIGCYRVHYAGGQQDEIPIIYGKDVLAWVLESRAESSGVVVAWRKDHPNGVTQQLYQSTWQNPRPATEIESLDLVSSLARSAPFVLAITAEP